MSSNDILKIAADRYVLGDLSSAELKGVAKRVVDEGVNSVSLNQLATLEYPTTAEASRLFERAHHELSISMPTCDEAVYRVVSRLVRSIAEGSSTTRQTLSELCAVVRACNVAEWHPDDRPDPLLFGQIRSIVLCEPLLYDGMESEEQERWNQNVDTKARLWSRNFGREVINPVCRTSTVLALAQSIYAARTFEHLPILADALEDTGCDNSDLLAHCRQSNPHEYGCWVLDLLLGKP